MKGYTEQKIILLFAVLLAAAALTATTLLFGGCAKDSAEDGFEGAVAETANETVLETERGETAEEIENVFLIDTFNAYSYIIGNVGNRNDPVYSSAVHSENYEYKDVYVHKFNSRAEVKSFLEGCALSSNYYVQEIANSIYSYDDEFFKTQTLYMVFMHSFGMNMRYGVPKVSVKDGVLTFDITESSNGNNIGYIRDRCWVTTAAADKKTAEACKEYKVNFEPQKSTDLSDLSSEPPFSVKLDFEYVLDYSIKEPEYNLNTIQTGLGYVSKVRDTALNKSSFPDKPTINLPLHTFTDSKSFADFWGTFDYPEEKRKEMEAFLAKYDSEFFKEKGVVTIFVDRFGEGSEYRVDSIKLQASTLHIELQRTKKGVDYTSGIDSQLLVFEMDRGDVARSSYFEAFINNEMRGVEVQPPSTVSTFTVKNSELLSEEMYKAALNAENEFEIKNGFRHLPIFRIETKKELTEIFGSYAEKENGENWTAWYGEGFFEENVLFAVCFSSYTSEARYEVSGLYVTDETVSVSYNKTAPDGEGKREVWITTIAIPKKYGRATAGSASVSETAPNRAIETNLAARTESNSFIDRFTTVNLTQPLDENSVIFTKAFNKDKLKNTDGKHIPIHLFKTYEEYAAVVGQVAEPGKYFAEKEFEYKDVYLLYIDKNTAEAGYYDLTVEFVKGTKCIMSMSGREKPTMRLEISEEKGASLVMFYCEKGYFNGITEFDAFCTENIDELKALLK